MIGDITSEHLSNPVNLSCSGSRVVSLAAAASAPHALWVHHYRSRCSEAPSDCLEHSSWRVTNGTLAVLDQQLRRGRFLCMHPERFHTRKKVDYLLIKLLIYQPFFSAMLNPVDHINFV